MSRDSSGSGLNIDWDDPSAPATSGSYRPTSGTAGASGWRTFGPPPAAPRPPAPPPRTHRSAVQPHQQHTFRLATAGFVGGILAWLIVELFLGPDHLFGNRAEVMATNVLFVLTSGLAIGLTIAAWGGIIRWNPQRILDAIKIHGPALVIVAVIGGVIADRIYVPWTQRNDQVFLRKLIEEDWSLEQAMQAYLDMNHVPRGVAWAVMGIAIGLGLTVVSRNRDRIVNAAVGGALGGFAGGFLFDYFPSGLAARSFGLAVTGAAIGLAIGTLESVRRQHRLRTAAGPAPGAPTR